MGAGAVCPGQGPGPTLTCGKGRETFPGGWDGGPGEGGFSGATLGSQVKGRGRGGGGCRPLINPLPAGPVPLAGVPVA